MTALPPPDLPDLDEASLDVAAPLAARVVHGFFQAAPRIELHRHLRRGLRRQKLEEPARGTAARLVWGAACLWRALGEDRGAPHGDVTLAQCRDKVDAYAARADPFSAPRPGTLDVRTLAEQASLPAAMARGLLEGAPDPWAAAWAYNRPGPMCLRARDGDAAALAEAITANGHGEVVGRGAHAPAALMVRRGFNVYAHPPTLRRRYEVQDEGSQLIAHALGLSGGERVLDVCAGRGGKSIALADMLAGEGEVVATDIDGDRRVHLRRRVASAGAKVTVVDGLKGLPRGSFDAVLVDAPCSAWGTLRRGPDLKWRIDARALALWPETQRSILDQAASFVRPKGRLVYATCTFRRAENDDVARGFVAAHRGFVPEAPPEVGTAGDLGCTLWPDVTGTDGFFIARFRRAGG